MVGDLRARTLIKGASERLRALTHRPVFQEHPSAADREPERRCWGDAGAGVRGAVGDAEAGSADRRLPGIHRAHHPQGPRGAQGRGEGREYRTIIYWYC